MSKKAVTIKLTDASVSIKGVHRKKVNGREYYYYPRSRTKGDVTTRLNTDGSADEFWASFKIAQKNASSPDLEDKKDMVVSDLIDAYFKHEKLKISTQIDYLPLAKELKSKFGTFPVSSLKNEKMYIGDNKYIALRDEVYKWQKSKEHKPRHADKCVWFFSRICGFAYDRGFISSNPLLNIKRLYKGGNRSDIVWTDDDLAKFCSVAPQNVANFILGLRYTGARKNELANLKWSDISVCGHFILIRQTKSERDGKAGKIVKVPMIKPLYDLLQTLDASNEYIFINSRGQKWESINKAFTLASRQAGIAKRMHDLRGTYITDMKSRGYSDDDMEYITGNASALKSYINRDANIVDHSKKQVTIEPFLIYNGTNIVPNPKDKELYQTK